MAKVARKKIESSKIYDNLINVGWVKCEHLTPGNFYFSHFHPALVISAKAEGCKVKIQPNFSPRRFCESRNQGVC
jgi:hypothetical protein